MNYQPSQPAVACDAALKASVHDMDTARHRAILWFADINRRRLYRELGYSNMVAYATAELKFSKTRTHDFLRLAHQFDRLPAVRESLASGGLGYTKAVEIVKVASPRTEKKWVAEAINSGRRELAQKVKRVKAKAAQRGSRQSSLIAGDMAETPLAAEVPLRVNLEMTPEQFARYEALLDKVGGHGGNRVEVLLAGLEAMAKGTSGSANSCEDDTSETPTRRRVTNPSFQVHVRKCPDCGEAAGSTNRGEKALGMADALRIACDARVRETGKPNRATIPPNRRAQVLERDGFRCRAPGCAHTRFLEVHHIVPRVSGGSNDPENLITLCAGCHRLHHEQKGQPAMATGT